MGQVSRQRVILFVAGLGVVVVILLGTAFRKSFEAAYYLYRLRQDPEYLFLLKKAANGTPENIAVRDFLASDRGRRALLTLFLREFEAGVNDTDHFQKNLNNVQLGVIGFEAKGNPEAGYSCNCWCDLFFDDTSTKNGCHCSLLPTWMGDCFEAFVSQEIILESYPKMTILALPLDRGMSLLQETVKESQPKVLLKLIAKNESYEELWRRLSPPRRACPLLLFIENQAKKI